MNKTRDDITDPDLLRICDMLDDVKARLKLMSLNEIQTVVLRTRIDDLKVTVGYRHTRAD